VPGRLAIRYLDEMAKDDRAVEARDPRWKDVLARAANADLAFVYAVRTTGAYCRASCGSRHANYENVLFFETSNEAEEAGYRACLRCEPHLAPIAERQCQQVIDLCRSIEACEELPTLGQLADEIGKSPSHTRRLFKDVTGLTPKEYGTSQLRKRMQEALVSTETITEAIFAAGYHSTSRFYEKHRELLGMTAGEYRARAKDQEIRFAVGECCLGNILVATTTKGVCAVLLGDDPDNLIEDLRKRFSKAHLIGADRSFEDIAAKVIAVVESPKQRHTLPLDVGGTAFQQRVWQALAKIPPGSTATYSEVADAIGSPSSVRAVASACGANAIAVLIPCHRVVRKGGGLSGYRWGVERKRALLDLEAEE
jgi:AraC family transcriptional regulator of adaptative response/methylated-DNA-[protein]-cysteine methyltransferase